MVPGENGFAVAMFGMESVQTEMPNLLLEAPAMKRPAAYKRPATIAEATCTESSIEESGSEEEKPSKKLKVEQPVEAKTIEATAAFTKENYRFESLSFGMCKAEFYTAKSYTRYFDEKAKKWTLLVGTQGQNHHAELERLVPFVKRANMEKADILELRKQ